jgi:flagellar motility protein MotE (MotC chaperone)
MSRIPRLLPLVGIAVGGVLAVKALADIDALPKAMAGARAFAEEAAKPVKSAKPAAKGAAKPGKGEAKATSETAPAETATSAPAVAPAATAVAPPIKVCAPSPAELAKDAGLSPAELQVLQSLGVRRTQLDAREGDIDTQLKLLAAAEAKLDTKLKGLTGLKADLQALLGQTEQKGSSEIDRLVVVYSKMKPKDAAAIMIQLEDKVRIPVAAKLKDAGLAAILSQMPPAEAKKLTESLAHRYDKVKQLAQSAAAPPPATAPAAPEADPTAPAKDAAPAKAAPKGKRARKAAAKAPVGDAANAVASAAATTPAAKPAATTPAATPAPAPTASAAPATTAKPAA